MTQKNNPQSERRAALDAAIAALDEQRRKLSDRANSGSLQIALAARQRQDELNRHIRILSDMREEGPLL